jgi:hypothetical protein
LNAKPAKDIGQERQKSEAWIAPKAAQTTAKTELGLNLVSFLGSPPI